MRQLSSALADHLASAATTLCHCWKLIRRDGTVMGFTDHDCDLVIDMTTYAAQSGLEGAAAESTLGFAIGGSQVTGALTSAALSEADLGNGDYDGASVEFWLVNWAEPSQRLLLDVGTIGEVRRSEYAFDAEIRGLAHVLDQERGRLYHSACAADLGDARCMVTLSAPAFTANASVVTTEGRILLAADLGAYAEGWFTGGQLRFTSGANSGSSHQVRSHRTDAAHASLALWTPAGAAIAIGDAFTVTAGCDKSFETCRDRFANAVNFRGFPQMPGNDHVLAYPTAGDPTLNGGSIRQ